jgi:hypothetical protein
MHPSVQNLISWVCELLGFTVSIPDNSFRLDLQPTPDGLSIFAQLIQLKTGGAPIFQQVVDARNLGSNGVKQALVSGLATINMQNKTGDLLAVRQVTAGGTPGAKWSVARVSDTQVAVASFSAGNSLASSDTSTVEVYNLGTPAM